MKKLKYIALILFITLLNNNANAINCAAYSAWSSGGQSAGSKTYESGGITRLYETDASNGWDGAGDNPSVNSEWTLIGTCGTEPEVTTQNETAVTSSTMTFHGTVTSNAGFAITDRGFIYGTDATDVLNSEIGALVGDSKIISEGGTTVAAFSQAITGLCPGITYYVMAYASNSTGDGYAASTNTALTTTPGNFTTTQGGAFSTASTWGGCSAPDLTLGHTINIGHAVTSSGISLTGVTDIVITSGGTLTNTGTITMGGSGVAASLTVDAGGTLTTANVSYGSGSTFNANGTTSITGTLTISSSGVFNTSGTTTIANILNGSGDFNQTAGTVTVTNTYDCANDCDFDQSGGAMNVGGNFKVWGSGESHMDGTLDVDAIVIVDNNAYMDGTGVLTYGSSNVNENNSGAYIQCVDGVKYDDHVGTAEGSVPASPWDLNTCTTLPIDLLSFDVKLIKGIVQIQWVTGSEINNDYFEVQASRNGVDWEVIQIVQGAGNSSDIISYIAYDYKTDSYDVKYYRLMQFDFDRKNEKSPIRLVDFSENAFFEAYASGDNILVKASFKKSATINVYDIKGKSVRVKTINNENVIEIPIDALSGSIYFITALIDGQLYSKKILTRF